MTRRPPRAAGAAALASLALVSAFGFLACRRSAPAAAPPAVGAAAPATALALPVDLYFPGGGGLLYPERRELAPPGDAEAQVRAVVNELLAGPQSPGLVSPFPEGVVLEAVHLGRDGVAFVDLAAPDRGEPPAAGSGLEMQIVYSLVNTVALNVPEARRVALLWNGIQRPTFAGHLDTSRPLAPAPALVAR